MPEKQEPVAFPNPNDEQLYIAQQFSRMIGKMYYLAESSFVNETQCNAFKRQMNDIIYDSRNSLMEWIDR